MIMFNFYLSSVPHTGHCPDLSCGDAKCRNVPKYGHIRAPKNQRAVAQTFQSAGDRSFLDPW